MAPAAAPARPPAARPPHDFDLHIDDEPASTSLPSLRERPLRGKRVVYIALAPQGLQWLALGALLLAFALTFFTWTAIAPENVSLLRQSAWQAADASYTADAAAVKEQQLKELFSEPSLPTLDSWLNGYLMLLPLSLFAVLLACFLARLPWAARLLPWCWCLATLLTVSTLVLLSGAACTGIGMERRVQETVAQRHETRRQQAHDDARQHELQNLRVRELSVLRRSWLVYAVVCLHLLAALCAGVVSWLELCPMQAIPYLELCW